MVNWIDYLPNIRKSFNTYGIVLLMLFGLFAAIVISISSVPPFNTTSVQCFDVTLSKRKDESLTKFLETKCSQAYEKRFQFSLPMNVMFIINFGIVFALSIIYGYLVKSRVVNFDYQTRADDDENQNMLPTLNESHFQVRECLGHFSTFFIYIVHLIISRAIPLLVFAVWIFCQADTPDSFACPLSEIKLSSTSSDYNDTQISPSNFTIDCTNPTGTKSTALVKAVATVDVVIVVLTVLELGYIAWVTLHDRNFMTDQEFCTVYLLRKRKRIRKLVNKVRERFEHQELFEIIDDFGDNEVSLRKLEDVYVNVVIQAGREHINAYPITFDRHGIYQAHLETPKETIQLTSTADIFKPIQGQKNESYPRTILVVGRPGIGKTILTRKLLQQWKAKTDDFWFHKIVILLQCRVLNNKVLSFREMLEYGIALASNNVETVYSFIISNPRAVVLIFDGLDELNVENEVLHSGFSPQDTRMPVFPLFSMLVKGRLLPGATILTTSRPTAQHLYQELRFDRTVEILGFFEEQIKEYVFKFCQEDVERSELIWSEINGSAELRSLCYVPVNSYIVCLTLKEGMDIGAQSSGAVHLECTPPKTITELYKRATKVLFYRHHPIYKSLKERPSDYLITPFPTELEEVLMKLKKVAFDGINQGNLIFERATGDEFGSLANCGFFHKLPHKRQNFFCFIHLTLQEFLAASYVVDDMDSRDQFLLEHVSDSKWHLVIQFAAGLIGDKIRAAQTKKTAGESYSKESKIQECFSNFLKRLEEWALSLGNPRSGGDQNAVLGIKCLYELQENDIITAVARKFVGRKNGELVIDMDKHITPIDSTALFEFLGNSKITKLSFRCKIEEKYSYDKMENLLFNTAGNTITSFAWKGEFTDTSIQYVFNALKRQHCQLTTLILHFPYTSASNIEISIQTAKYLNEALKSDNCKLSKFHLQNVKGENIESGNYLLKYICDALKSGDCKLTDLILTLNNGVGDEDVKELCDATKSKDCKITNLKLCHNGISDKGVQFLSNLCQDENCQITKLDVYGNRITDRGVEYLSDACKRKSCKLTKLRLGDNFITDEGVQSLSDACKAKSCKLTKLHLNKTNITDQGVQHLSEALESENNKLNVLDLENNRVTDIGVEYICKGLGNKNCKLVKLNLANTEITDKGIEHLSKPLKSGNCKLTELFLARNEITEKGLQYLSDACKCENCKLSELDIYDNKITDVGIKHLSNVLKSENCQLTKLNIYANSVTDEVVKYLSEAMKHENCKLLELHLGHVLTEKCFEYLADAVENENCKLSILYLRDPGIVPIRSLEEFCDVAQKKNITILGEQVLKARPERKISISSTGIPNDILIGK